MNSGWIISSILGAAVGWLIARRTRKADSEASAISITPRMNVQIPGRFHAIPRDQWPKLPPELIAALWYCREVPPEAMPDMAAGLLEQGFDGKWLKRCVGLIKPTSSDIEFADKMFQELGVAAPLTDLHSRELIGAFMAEQILDGTLDPFAGADRIAMLNDWDSDFGHSPLQQFIDMAEQNELTSRDNEEEVRQRILEACRELRLCRRTGN